MRIIWSQHALDRLDHIENFYERTNPAYGKRIVADIFLFVGEMLPTNPRMGHKMEPLYLDVLREIHYDNYRIIYILAGDHIKIHEVRHFRELRGDFPDFLF